MKKIVISQPMFFPWIGMFEQIRLADIYVHYDDVQFPQGYCRSYINRVQIKLANGVNWLTVPVKRKGIFNINETLINESTNWREKHLKTIQAAYGKCDYYEDARKIVQDVYSFSCKTISEINIYALQRVCEYFSICKQFEYSSKIPSDLRSSDRVLSIVKQYNGGIYITGWGAKDYLDHELFEKNGVRVEYMDYKMRPYHQRNGKFTPYVSILDLIANEGKKGIEYINSPTIYWKDMIKTE